MNVYRVVSDGQGRLVLSNHFAGAIDRDFEIFLHDNKEWLDAEHYTSLSARLYYESILEQVVVVGELAERPHVDDIEMSR